MTGKDINKNQAVNVKKIVYISLMLTTLLSIGGIALFTSAAEPLTAIFISRDSPNFEYILSLTKILFAINSINSIADGLRNVCAGGLSGFYDVVAPTLISFVGLWLIGTPLAATLAFPVNQGVNGLLGGKGVGLFSTGFALVRRWKVKSDNPRLAISDGQKSFLSRNKNLLVCESSCRKNREAEGSTPLIPGASSNRDNVSIENRYEKNCFSRISRSCIIL